MEGESDIPAWGSLASFSVIPVEYVHKYRGDNVVGAVEEMRCVVCVGVTRGEIVVMDVFASTLCKYDLRKGDLFVPSWVSVRRVRREVSLQSC